MSEDGTLDEGEGIKNLRKQYEDQQKELKETRDALAGYRKQDRDSAVKGYLKAKGVPEEAVSLYMSDDASEDAVGKWVEQHAAILRPAADPNAQAAAAVSAASFGANGDTEPVATAAGKVIGDPAEIARLIATLPYPELVKLGIMPKGDQFVRPHV